jgi:enoyl-[acyl-carrier-protein] reductase (NADH)
MALHQFPAHYGFFFTKTFHSKAEGPTDPQNIQLKNPFVVAVTGAGKGIGYRVALQFARAGASGIVISSRTQKDLDALSAELFSINSNLEVLSFLCDITNEAQVANFASAVKDKFGRLDAIIAKCRFDIRLRHRSRWQQPTDAWRAPSKTTSTFSVRSTQIL